VSMVEAMGRIQQIQSTITQLSSPPAAASTRTTAASGLATSGTSTSGTSTSGTGTAGTGTADLFAEALAATGATGSTQTPSVSAPSASTVPNSGDATGADLIEASKKYIGLPYVWGGTDPSVGLDCSSFVQQSFRDIGVDVPRVTWDQINVGTEVSSMAEARPGDLLFSFDGGHVSIYLGNGKAIDAPQPGDTIQIRDAWENESNITAIRRVIPSGDEASAGAGISAAGASTGGSGAALTDMLSSAQAALATGRAL
jgi:cell wall-associated NlpC family hydrolase